MGKGRLEAFSDGVLAIIITITVLDLHVPHEVSLRSLQPLIPVFLSYILSFTYVGIYWNNHHHLLHAAEHVSGGVLWANLHLLFWLSLAPFLTSWMGENRFASLPVAMYGVMLWFAAVAYFLLTKALVRQHGKDSVLARAVGEDRKGMLSMVTYTVSIVLAFWLPRVACLGYAAVALGWLLPDRRIERRLADAKVPGPPLEST